MRLSQLALVVLYFPALASAQRRAPGGEPRQPIAYSLVIDSARATTFTVEIRVPRTDTLRLAMPAHPEYDDRFWRYVRDVHVVTAGGEVAVVREDSMLWRAVVHRAATVRYRVAPPPPTRGQGSWRAYLSPSGGLVGGPHSFMYVVGAEQLPVTLSMSVPSGWTIATGITRLGANRYAARDFAELMDGPLLVGLLHRWSFAVRGVSHEVAFLPTTGAAPDSAVIVPALQKLVIESRAVFDRFPYPRFTFLLEEDARGGLEHGTSVSLGAPGGPLDRVQLADFVNSAAHEYFHAWNEVALRPRGWGGLSYRPSPTTTDLWWTEGVTMYYTDVLTRRAGLPAAVPTRSAQLARDIGEYLDQPDNALVSPEASSAASGRGLEAGTRSDVYLQGKLAGAVLDLVIRGATDNRRSLDHAMRLLFARQAGRGFTGVDVERAVRDTCGCDAHAFFERYIRHAAALPFAASLALAGLTLEVNMSPAVDDAGHPQPDLRVWAQLLRGEPSPRLILFSREGAWPAAGLATGDRIVSWNGQPMTTMAPFRTSLRSLAIGDSVALDVERDGARRHAVVRLASYDTHRVSFREVAAAGARERRVRAGAMLGATTSP